MISCSYVQSSCHLFIGYCLVFIWQDCLLLNYLKPKLSFSCMLSLQGWCWSWVMYGVSFIARNLNLQLKWLLKYSLLRLYFSSLFNNDVRVFNNKRMETYFSKRSSSLHRFSLRKQKWCRCVVDFFLIN